MGFALTDVNFRADLKQKMSVRRPDYSAAQPRSFLNVVLRSVRRRICFAPSVRCLEQADPSL